MEPWGQEYRSYLEYYGDEPPMTRAYKLWFLAYCRDSETRQMFVDCHGGPDTVEVSPFCLTVTNHCWMDCSEDELPQPFAVLLP